MIQHMKGKVPRQAHVAVPAGLYEDELGRRRFSGRVAYRVVPATADHCIEIIEARGEVTVPDRGLVGQYAP